MNKNNETTQQVEQSTPKTENKLFKNFLLLLPVSGAFSILLGYGYMTGIAQQFGYAATDIVADTQGFIFAGLYPVFTIFSKVFSWEYFCNLLRSGASDWWALLYIAIFGSMYLGFNLFFRTKQKKRKALRKLRKLPKLFVGSPSWIRVVVESLLVVVASVTYKLIITVLGYGIFITFTSVLLLGFALGYKEGANFAQEEIIKPKSCAPYIKETGRNVDKTAYCARVIMGGKEIARGRVIAFNSERIFLNVKKYSTNAKQERKEFRVPKSFPIRNAIVERVNTEDI